MNTTFGRLPVALLSVSLLTGLVGPAAASFVNGDFEDGTLNGWTVTSGTWSVDPAAPHAVTLTPFPGHLLTGTNGPPAGVTTNIFDPLTNNNLNEVYSGSHAAVIGDHFGGFDYTTLEQTVAGWTSTEMDFAWAAVLEEPTNGGHATWEMPHFSITLTDTTRSMVLYNQAFNVTDTIGVGGGWHDGLNDMTPLYSSSIGLYKYTDWVPITLDTSAYVGDDFLLQVSVFDCAQGGHGGYAYVDGFGSAPLATPEPGTLLLLTLGLGGCGARAWKRRKAAA